MKKKFEIFLANVSLNLYLILKMFTPSFWTNPCLGLTMYDKNDDVVLVACINHIENKTTIHKVFYSGIELKNKKDIEELEKAIFS